MLLLILKLTLTPALIAVASLIGRRWGPTVSGWLVGLPFTSGPVLYFIAVSHNAAFTTTAAVATMASVLSEVAFCLAMAWLCLRWGWLVALTGGCLAFFAATAGLQRLPLSALVVFPAMIVALGVALCLMPGRASASLRALSPVNHAPSPTPIAVSIATPLPANPSPRPHATLPWWDLPARMIIATLFVIALTDASSRLGAQLTGLLAPFPIYVSILAVFAYRQDGPQAAVGTLRGLLLGLLSFAAFFLVVALLLTQVSILATFGLAIVVALAIQGGSLWALTHLARRPS